MYLYKKHRWFLNFKIRNLYQVFKNKADGYLCDSS